MFHPRNYIPFMSRDNAFNKESFFTFFKQKVEEEIRNAKELKVPMKMKALFVALFLLPLLIQVVAIACGKSDIGYWMFLPDVLIIVSLIIKKQIK